MKTRAHQRYDEGQTAQTGGHYRTDRGTLKPAHRTDEGFLLLEGVAAVPGVYDYVRTDGTTVRELIDAAELGSTKSLGTLGRKPVTRHHPKTGMVTPATAADVAVGSVGEQIVVAEGGFVQVSMVVHRGDAITDIERGARELSCGYYCDLDETPGVWTDAAGVEHRYDARQVNRRYNHIAIVDRGRHGPAASLRVDGAVSVAEQSTGEHPNSTEPETVMKFKIRIDGREYEIEAANAEEALKIQARMQAMADAEKKVEQLQGRVDSLEEQLKTVKAEAEKLRTDAARPTPEQIQQRIALVLLAEKHQVKREDAMKLDDAGLKRAIATAVHPNLKLDDASEPYLDGLLAGIEAGQPSPVQAAGSVVAPQAHRADGGASKVPSFDEAHAAYMQKLKDASKPPKS